MEAAIARILEPSTASATVPESSDRSFGLVFAAALSLIAGLPMLRSQPPRWWALGLAAAFAWAAITRPGFLHPLNRLWLALGRLLHRIVSPVAMGAVFFLCVAPIAWIMRRRGTDPLSLRWRPESESYWITRPPPRPAAKAMREQF